jgi:hypothetical protein
MSPTKEKKKKMKRPSFLPFFPPYETVKPAGFFPTAVLQSRRLVPRVKLITKKANEINDISPFFFFFFFFPFVQTLTVHSPFQPIIRIIIIGRDHDLSTVGGIYGARGGGGSSEKRERKKRSNEKGNITNKVIIICKE